MAAATTALMIGATTTFAASNTHTHDIQLMGKDDSWASSLRCRQIEHYLSTGKFVIIMMTTTSLLA